MAWMKTNLFEQQHWIFESGEIEVAPSEVATTFDAKKESQPDEGNGVAQWDDENEGQQGRQR